MMEEQVATNDPPRSARLAIALKNADAAGDTDAAKKLAAAYKDAIAQESQPAQTPSTDPFASAPSSPAFGGGGAASAGIPRPAPTASPSMQGGGAPPSLSATEADIRTPIAIPELDRFGVAVENPKIAAQVQNVQREMGLDPQALAVKSSQQRAASEKERVAKAATEGIAKIAALPKDASEWVDPPPQEGALPTIDPRWERVMGEYRAEGTQQFTPAEIAARREAGTWGQREDARERMKAFGLQQSKINERSRLLSEAHRSLTQSRDIEAESASLQKEGESLEQERIALEQGGATQQQADAYNQKLSSYQQRQQAFVNTIRPIEEEGAYLDAWQRYVTQGITNAEALKALDPRERELLARQIEADANEGGGYAGTAHRFFKRLGGNVAGLGLRTLNFVGNIPNRAAGKEDYYSPFAYLADEVDEQLERIEADKPKSHKTDVFSDQWKVNPGFLHKMLDGALYAGTLSAAGATGGVRSMSALGMAGSSEDYYREGIESGLKPKDSEIVSLLLSGTEASIEALNLGPFVNSGARKSIMRGAVDAIKKGAAPRLAAKESFARYMAEQMGAEAGEEVLTSVAQSMVKKGAEMATGVDQDTELALQGLAGDAVMGAAIGGLMGGVGRLSQRPLYKEGVAWAVQNSAEFRQYVAQNIPEAEQGPILERFEVYEKVYRGLPSDMKDDAKMTVAHAVAEKERLKKEKGSAIVDDVVSAMTGNRFDAQIKEQDEIIAEASGTTLADVIKKQEIAKLQDQYDKAKLKSEVTGKPMPEGSVRPKDAEAPTQPPVEEAATPTEEGQVTPIPKAVFGEKPDKDADVSVWSSLSKGSVLTDSSDPNSHWVVVEDTTSKRSGNRVMSLAIVEKEADGTWVAGPPSIIVSIGSDGSLRTDTPPRYSYTDADGNRRTAIMQPSAVSIPFGEVIQEDSTTGERFTPQWAKDMSKPKITSGEPSAETRGGEEVRAPREEPSAEAPPVSGKGQVAAAPATVLPDSPVRLEDDPKQQPKPKKKEDERASDAAVTEPNGERGEVAAKQAPAPAPAKTPPRVPLEDAGEVAPRKEAVAEEGVSKEVKSVTEGMGIDWNDSANLTDALDDLKHDWGKDIASVEAGKEPVLSVADVTEAKKAIADIEARIKELAPAAPLKAPKKKAPKKEVAAATDEPQPAKKQEEPPKPTSEPTWKREGQKSVEKPTALTDKAKALADRLRKGKLGDKGLKSAVPGFVQAWDTALEVAASAIEAGGDAAQAIANAIDSIRDSDWYKKASKKEREEKEAELSDFVTSSTTEEPKRVKKTITTKRAYEGEFRDEVKKELEKIGLYRSVENREEARGKAAAFVAKVGADAALDAVRNGDVRGAEATYVFKEAISDIQERIANETDAEALAELYAQEAALVNELNDEGTAMGRFIGALGSIYEEDDLGFRSEVKASEWRKQFGEEPSAELMEKWKQRDKEFAELEKKLKDAEERAAKAEEQSAVEAIKESIARERRKPRTYTQKSKDLADRFRKLKTQPMVFKDANGNVIEVKEMGFNWNELVEVGAKAIEKTGQLADGIAAIAEKLKASGFFANMSDKDREAVMQQIEERFRAINEEDTDGRIRIPKQMIREAVIAGAEDIDTLVDVIMEQVKDEYPDATKREIRDAITEYGKVVNMSQDEISAKIRRMKDIGRTISAIEDVENRIRPLRSGLQRDKLDAEQRALKKKLREMMKELPIDEQTQLRELRTALDAAKSRTRNRIEDMEREIEMRERIRRSNKVVEPDAELQALIQRKEDLQKEHDEIFKDKSITEEERLQRAVDSARRSLDDVQRKIREMDIEPKKPTPLNETPELRALRDELGRAREEFRRLQEEAGIMEKRRLDAAKKMAAARIDDYRRRLEERDFSKKEKKAAVSDTELERLRAEKIRLKEEYDKEFYKESLRHRTVGQWIKDFIWEAWGFARAVKATSEISFVLIQSGTLTVSNLYHRPSVVASAFRNMWDAMKNEKKSEDWLRKIKAQDWYPVAKEAKLAITEPHAELSAREELFVSDWTRIFWDIIGSPLLLKSKSAHERWSKANPFRALERGAVSYLNTLRAERFLDGMAVLDRKKAAGEEITKQDYKDVADAINTLTGRASLGKGLEPMAKTLTKVFFSPRLWASGIKTATPYALWYFGKMRPTARKLALQDLGRMVGTTMGIVALAAAYLNNDDDDETGVEMDPRSSDFGKIKLGEIRVDPWSGRIQQVVLTSRLTMGGLSLLMDKPLNAYKDKHGQLMPLGSGSAPTMGTVLARMATNKLSPAASMLVEAMGTRVNKDGTRSSYGKEYSIDDKMIEAVTPIYFETISELVKEDPGALEGFLIFYAFFGGGVSIQEPSKKKSSSSSIPTRGR